MANTIVSLKALGPGEYTAVVTMDTAAALALTSSGTIVDLHLVTSQLTAGSATPSVLTAVENAAGDEICRLYTNAVIGAPPVTLIPPVRCNGLSLRGTVAGTSPVATVNLHFTYVSGTAPTEV